MQCSKGSPAAPTVISPSRSRSKCWSRRSTLRLDCPQAARSKRARIHGPGRRNIGLEAAAPWRFAVRFGTALRKGGAVNEDELQREIAKLRADYAAQVPGT